MRIKRTLAGTLGAVAVLAFVAVAQDANFVAKEIEQLQGR